MVVLDTNVIVDHLRQTDTAQTYLMKIAEEVSKENLAISIITIQELYEGESTRNEREEERLLATISPLKILPYIYETAQLAGEIARDLKRPIELADAAIAATTIVNGASLFTLNKKDFRGIENLELFESQNLE